ncbi:MAG: hypothetical protein GMKNLPBB_02075 [Myxococcota bacterium]|nr:hypothetical protein [Myxococcota bacterium]
MELPEIQKQKAVGAHVPAIAVAGITGYTGRHLLPLLDKCDLRLLVRPSTAAKPPWSNDPRVRAVEQDQPGPLVEHLRGAQVIICLVGTLRSKFSGGDTYEKVDIGIPRALAQAGKQAGCQRMILLSSLGAGTMPGAYLDAKRAAEKAVRESGLSWVILRPSAFMGGEDDGERSKERAAPQKLDGLFQALSALPGVGGWVNDVRPIAVSDLARAIHWLALNNDDDGRVLSGDDIRKIAARA